VDAPAPAAPASAPEEPAKRRGRPPKSATSTTVDHVAPASAPEVVILADAFTVGAQSLDAVVAEYAAKIATQAGAPDIRASEHEALKFGKWKGVLAAMAREGVAALAPGWYTIDTRGDFGAVVVEAVAGLGNVRIVRGTR
jgi:hypothetical protein